VPSPAALHPLQARPPGVILQLLNTTTERDHRQSRATSRKSPLCPLHSPPLWPPRSPAAAAAEARGGFGAGEKRGAELLRVGGRCLACISRRLAKVLERGNVYFVALGWRDEHHRRRAADVCLCLALHCAQALPRLGGVHHLQPHLPQSTHTTHTHTHTCTFTHKHTHTHTHTHTRTRTRTRTHTHCLTRKVRHHVPQDSTDL